MSEHKPWTADSMGRVWGSDGKFIAECDSPEIATLVAAAPEMREALMPFEFVAEGVNSWIDESDDDFAIRTITVTRGNLRAVLVAIAKAEGRT